MNITKQNIDELNATLTLQVGKEDYEERIEKKLGEYRRKANMPGFRPGKVPASLINKMYRKAVLADEINKLVSESINEYLKTQDIHVLGDPLPNETENKTIDFDNDTEFKFVFDLGLSPEFEVNASNKDKIVSYEIKVDDTLVESHISNYTRRFGKFVECTEVAENEMIKGDIAQVDAKGNVVEGGIFAADSSIYLELTKDETEKKAFAGSKIGDVVKFDIKKAFPNDFEIAGLLKIEKDQVAAIDPNFQISIKTISRFEQAELNEELFDKVYSGDEVKTAEDFRNKITSEIRENLSKDEDYKFGLDAKKYFIEKLKLQLPSAFMKRWLTFMNEGKVTAEQIEKEFPLFEEDMKWQLIKNKFAKANNFEIKEEEVIEYSKEMTRAQFKQYGLNNIPDEQIAAYAVNVLKKEEDVRKIVEKIMESKIVSFIKENVSLDKKQVSNEEFGKLFN
jgi:trigger factor